MKFAMYGSGGAGSVFASYLRRGGADIILIDRYAEHMRKVAADGKELGIPTPTCTVLSQVVRAIQANYDRQF